MQNKYLTQKFRKNIRLLIVIVCALMIFTIFLAILIGGNMVGIAVIVIYSLIMTGAAIFSKLHENRFKQNSDDILLQKEGIKANAVILKSWDTGTTINFDPLIGFLLEVQPEGKPAFQAELEAIISRLQIHIFQPGAVLPVVYDPNDHSKVSFIYDGE